MNSRQLKKLGVPDDCLRVAMDAVRRIASEGGVKGKGVKLLLGQVLEAPGDYVQHEQAGELARALIAEKEFTRPEPIEYKTWGEEGIDQGSHDQMRAACQVPVARGAALMPDAHIGYGLPIGGVLACENAVIPYAVGVDIACRMKLSVFDLPVETLEDKFDDYKVALEKGTCFGVGGKFKRKKSHDVMDQDWTVTKVTRERKDKAWAQLGSSGSGNHFAEFGVFTLSEKDEELGLEPGEYVALLSHSGSRGVGAAVCSTYSAIARAKLPKKYEHLNRLGWLDLDSEEGQNYWAAMNLMGDYAAANHAVIHQSVSKLIGGETISGVENHHNFAWKEQHFGKELVVHRKGATPAGKGELGVIPGSMASPAFIVRGKGNPDSFNSASHGAGRVMSRKKAKDTYNFAAIRNDLAKKGVKILSAGADEVPYVYKDIYDVMDRQADLVDIVAKFDPRIVKMCDDGSRPED